VFVYIFVQNVSDNNERNIVETGIFELSTMSDGNNEVDEQFEQLRVGKLTLAATLFCSVYVTRELLNFVRASLHVKVYNCASVYYLYMCVLQNAFVDELVTDIIDDVTCGLCFEIHRACKLGILFLDETDPE